MAVSGCGPVRELLARASAREAIMGGEGRSGAAFERVIVDGTAYFVKRLSPATDWIMRVTGDNVHRPYLIWQAGMMDLVPACIDHTVVGMDLAGTGADAVLTTLMRDVGGLLVPPGETVVSPAQHAGFIRHMAALAAAYWGWDDDLGLTTMAQRMLFLAPGTIVSELAVAEVPVPVAAAAAGWQALPGRSPLLAGLARLVHGRPEVITGPLAGTPCTFLHGDWKMANLGTHPDGRTILLDWTLPGAGPACWELCWYLALNQARLPEPKEAVTDQFRAELEACGIGTAGWWEPQLDLCMIAIMAAFGWEKALGDDGELGWWEDAVARAAARRGVAA